jgi:hypothetical protein
MAIDAFISRPTKLPKPFEDAYKAFHAYAEKHHGLRLRRLGSTDYSDEAPLRAIIDIMDECKGAIILGYPQIEIYQHIRRSDDVSQDPTLLFPTPWNQIEASLAFGAKLPVLVIGHPGIGGGVFDHGVTGQYVLTEDLSLKDWFLRQPFQQLLAKWKQRIDPTLAAKKMSQQKTGRAKR